MESLRHSPLGRLSLRWKLYFILAVTSGMFVVACAVGYLQLKANERNWNNLDQEVWRKQHLLHEIQSSLGFGHGIHDFKNLVLRKDVAQFDDAHRDFTSALASLDKFLALPSLTKTEQTALSTLKKVITRYRDNLSLAKALILEGRSAEEIDRQVMIEDFEATAALDKIQASVRKISLERREDHLQMTRSTSLTLLIAWVLSLGVSFFVTQLVSRNISRSVDHLVKDAEKVASGELHHKIEGYSQDEIGKLGSSIEKMRSSLTKAITSLETSNKDLEQYAYIVSHDLQEPLRKILAFGGYIQSSTKGKLDGESEFYLAKVLESTSRMRALIDDLLAYSRASKKHPEKSEVDANQIVKNVWQDLELLVQEKNAEIKVGPLPCVLADRLLIHQLFQNLIHNSLKFSKPGTRPVIEVFSCESAKPGFVEFRIRDNGIGFSQKFADRILIPFQRLHGRSEYPGSGIGLAICNRIIDKHGGTLHAVGAPGEGSEFKFSLPRTV